MSNHFEVMTDAFIKRHGLWMILKKVGPVVFNETTLISTATETDHDIKSYPKHVTATPHNYPNLIGKDVVMFYIGSSCEVFPEELDIMLYDDKRYVIDKIQKHMAFGKVLLYRCLAISA